MQLITIMFDNVAHNFQRFVFAMLRISLIVATEPDAILGTASPLKRIPAGGVEVAERSESLATHGRLRSMVSLDVGQR